ncbi:oxidoreductase [Siphonobacter sp. BAB-5385]|uniref:Gfo/Idh/MocA family protein n=1 Tax=Siphonobacter sp. BAB-5385 TaxID=1864822 RepID=UPI000B9E7757|nr:Gfo/Idh/MocA family oxidoreductase [Siphonobacter sp. BAB-5385]OZI09984.1 oxidoreductase [Siphonobacter sp. BAB-5385]
MKNSRRTFLRTMGGSAAALSMASWMPLKALGSAFSPNDTIQVGLIGAGIIGHFDVDTILQVPGVELVAACDLYDPRLVRAKEKWGNHLYTTRDYREILSRPDIDAVIVAVPDHWHDHISIAALEAGKHVYCEKPMVHHIEEGAAVIAAQKKSGKVFQVGSQAASSVGVLEAQKYIKDGALGEISFVEATNDRVDALGAWQYTIPFDLDPKQVDWDRYLGDAPKRPFEAHRFFRWRNYKEYGTGVAGDLFVHLLTTLHTITGSTGPNRIFALGDLNYWKDGRDAYDLVTGVMDYPKTDQHPSFQFFTRVNLADGGGGSHRSRIVGTEGSLELNGDGFVLRRFKRPQAPPFSLNYDALITYPKAMQEAFLKEYDAKYPKDKFSRGVEKQTDIVFNAPEKYNARLSHMEVFVKAIRENKPALVKEDATFGLRAAAPSLACNLSVEKKKPIAWDPDQMKIVG